MLPLYSAAFWLIMFVIRCNDQHKWMKSRTKNAHISRTSGTKKWRNSLENSVILVNERETFFRFAYIHVIGTRYISEPSNKLKILLQNIFVLFYRVPLPRLKVDLLYLGKENIRMLFFFCFRFFLFCAALFGEFILIWFFSLPLTSAYIGASSSAAYSPYLILNLIW